MTDLISRAAEFAKLAHGSIGQRRKTGEPYIVHPEAVAALVEEVTDDPAMIAAAWLHDVVEDTPVELNEIELQFDTEVAVLVEQLTDVSSLGDGNREARKALDRQHTAVASARAKTVKLADIIANLEGITGLTRGFAFKYIRESESLLEVLTEGDSQLYQRAKQRLHECRSELE